MHHQNTSQLEDLPNEILLEIFGYIASIDLLQQLYDLNIRFNLLLYKQFRSYSFRFNSISKRDFDTICQQHLPYVANQVKALELIDGINTPDQINLFLSYIPSLQHFNRLESLSLYNLHSYQPLLKLLDECQYLPNLVHLYFKFCTLRDASADGQLIIDKIWGLPKLINCCIDIQINGTQTFYRPSIISTSIKTLNIFPSNFQWDDMNRLIEYTPYLKSLSTIVLTPFMDNYTVVKFLSLTKFHFYFCDKYNLESLNCIFQSMPNLRQLHIISLIKLIHGRQWQYIISNYLPKLKTFYLRMNESFYFRKNIQRIADTLYNSFRSSFWINERKWFIWCLRRGRTISIYTHANTYDYYQYAPFDSCRSTCSNTNLSDFYNAVTDMSCEPYFDDLIPSDIRLLNITRLGIDFPINNQFWSIVPNLKKLRRLIISSYADIYQSQLQRLFDRAPHLYLLDINRDASLPLQMSVFNCTNPSVHRLDLYNYKPDFGQEECLLLIRSSLGIQCEVLLINVTNRETIVIICKNMVNLRVLRVKCADDPYCEKSILANHTDELVQWLKDHLSSRYLIVRDNSMIAIWM